MSIFKNVRKIADGNPINANITNKPINDLEERDNYLRSLISDLAYFSRVLWLENQNVSDDCLESQVVYLDEDEAKWKPGRAIASGIESSTIIELSPSSYVQGIVRSISGSAGSKKGNVYTYGAVDSVVTSNLIQGGSSPELNVPYYLSLTDDGKITTMRPTVAEVFVGKFLSLSTFLFTPNVSLASKGNVFHEHTWQELNNDNFVYEGAIGPSGEDQWIYAAEDLTGFPPIPYSSAVLVVNGTEFYYNSCYKIDMNGLHYWNNAYPPVDAYVQYKLYFTRVSTSASGILTSLTPGTNNVELKSIQTNEDSTTGDLKINVLNTISYNDSNPDAQSSSLVIKSIATDEATGDLVCYRGNIVTEIVPGAGININQSTGQVEISTISQDTEGIEISDIVLLNAKERIIDNDCLSYIELPYGYESGLLAKYLVDNDPKPTDIVLYYFGSKDEDNNCRLLIYRKVINMGGSAYGNVSVQQIDISVNTTIKRINLFSLNQDQIGKDSVVSFRIKRLAGDSYTGNLGILWVKRVEM